jgi:hypothetical protein
VFSNAQTGGQGPRIPWVVVLAFILLALAVLLAIRLFSWLGETTGRPRATGRTAYG